MGSIGFEEMLVIIVVAILVYGRNLPQAARKAGQFYTKVKRQITDMKDEIQRQIPTMDEMIPPEKPEPEGKSDPDPPGHAAMGSTPSANLPGPDPSDPEYKGPFDPSKPPPANGNGHAVEKKDPAPPATPAL